MIRALRISAAIVIGVCAIFYLACVDHVEAYQAGITWNMMSGDLGLDSRAGYHLTMPWVLVSKVDTRPQRVCITSEARIFNCKLVQFEPHAYRQFVAIQGFYYYWWTNRISFNYGYTEEYRGMRDLLRGYAFSGSTYPFITVLSESMQ